MSLVGYASSEEDDQSLPEAPAETKVVTQVSSPAVSAAQDQVADEPPPQSDGPIAGPSFPPEALHEPDDVPDGPPLSPYSANRAQIQALTMPRFADFDIPRSPSPPPANSEEAAELTARTRKFERFLELKKQGVHFNDRLASSTALRNPELLQKLADFAGISPEERYENTMGDALAVPTRWPDGFLENLVASNQKRMKKERDSRTKVGFVPATAKARRT